LTKPKPKIKVTQNKNDWVWGLETDPNSPDFGKVVVETILLWKSPGANPTGNNLGGALRHGSKVEVIATRTVKKVTYHKVTATVQYAGQEYPQTGWVMASMLRYRGENARREKYERN